MSDVVYIWDPTVSAFSYGEVATHPMKPLRLRMTHTLIESMGLLKHMRVLTPPPLPHHLLETYHAAPYIDFLQASSASPLTNSPKPPPSPYAPYFPPKWVPGGSRLHEGESATRRLLRFNVDCPPFPGAFPYSARVVAGSLAGAVLLNARLTTCAVHWGGGMHHARAWASSGFCYLNDVVVAILELLKVHRRVLYVDIDIHHGDAVEEAFYTTDRVFTLSLHKGGAFYTCTRSRGDRGVGEGAGYALNLPLRDGIRDEVFYHRVFCPLLEALIRVYAPEAIVMQCGADSVAGDRIGTFNLSSLGGHAKCVRKVRDLGIPTLFLGGGGYTLTHVARTWAAETALLCGIPVHPYDAVPEHDFSSFYSPFDLMGVPCDPVRQDQNTDSYIEKLVQSSLESIEGLAHPKESCCTGVSENQIIEQRVNNHEIGEVMS